MSAFPLASSRIFSGSHGVALPFLLGVSSWPLSPESARCAARYNLTLIICGGGSPERRLRACILSTWWWRHCPGAPKCSPLDGETRPSSPVSEDRYLRPTL